MRNRKIVIIGGGPAGYEAALAAAKCDGEVTLIHAGKVGGSAVALDCVPSKTFIAGSAVKTDLRRADDMGLNDGIGKAIIDIEHLNNRVKALADRQTEDIAQSLLDAGITLLQGTARFVDKAENQVVHDIEVTRPDGSTQLLEAHNVLIATGANPRVLPKAVPDGERILDWRQVYDLKEYPEHLIVCGSGVTGAEFVSAFAELGVRVTMVASRDRILPHDDADAADVLEAVLAERGVALEKNARVEEVVNTGSGVIVKTADGREIHGSHALMTVGAVPNTKDLGLEKVGVETTPSGHIHVDLVSRTDISGIYAAGDCTDVWPLASVAAMQGRLAMYHALGEGVAPLRRKTVANAVFTRPEIAQVGVTQAEIESGKVSARIYKIPLKTNPRAKMRALNHGFVKIFCRQHSGIVIGGVIVAPTASELILPLALAVTKGLTVADLAETFAVYPSLSGSITEAARRLVRHDDLS